MNPSKKNKIAFIGNRSSFISAIILKGLLDILAKQNDIELSCVIDSKYGKENAIGEKMRLAFVKFVYPQNDQKYFCYKNFIDVARMNNIPEFSPIDFNLNNIEFCDKLKNQANVIISCANSQILAENFLDSFEYSVNYHNSLLPKYRGLGATPISIYKNEKITGYTFHLITKGIDEGNILLSDCIPVDQSKSGIQHEWEKANLAVTQLNDLVTMINNRSPGRIQSGESSYYSNRDLQEMINIDSPRDYTLSELQRMISIFGRVFLNKEYFTKISSSKKGIQVKDCNIAGSHISRMPKYLYKMLKIKQKILSKRDI